ncbi:chemotaxis protein CheB [Filimonas effusa]|uniref:protein-glutamate methylesterase n=1 Tax=Filimonas effusa TaxID=2508721 RepID=A0A4Q1DAB9_9BACT|nr:chemotaxis protein CheB [Filimonas effusa]RXK86331.1 chemotaxis protein CheB [Filimonas effusa]
MAQNRIIPAAALIAIGGSAGSLDVLLKTLPFLEPSHNKAILIILHRKPTDDEVLVELLAFKSAWPVKEAEEGEPILPGHVYVAPPDYHLLIESNRSFSLDASEKINYSRPSIDVSFESAAEVYGPTLVALILSGANTDGTAGMKIVKKRGGTCAAQSPASATTPYMPQHAIKSVQMERVLQPDEIPAYINQLFSGL